LGLSIEACLHTPFAATLAHALDRRASHPQVLRDLHIRQVIVCLQQNACSLTL